MAHSRHLVHVSGATEWMFPCWPPWPGSGEGGSGSSAGMVGGSLLGHVRGQPETPETSSVSEFGTTNG